MTYSNRLVMGLAVVGGLASIAHAISLTDYTFPTSTTQQAYVNGTFNADGNSTDTTQVGYNFGGSGSYWLALRSLPFSYDVTAGASASTNRATADGASAENAWDVNVATTLDKYLRNDEKFFVYGAAAVDYRKLAFEDKADDPRVDVEAGMGFGRTINATVLKQAVRMDEDFVKYGITTRGMPDAALLSLAAIIDREDEFRSQYGPVEYRKYWYAEMENILVDAGVMATSSLGAMGVLRIQEVLVEPSAQRWHGWKARAGVGARISDYDGSSGDPTLTARLDWHRPIGMDLQITNSTALSTVLSSDVVYTLEDLFRVDYEISNRIDWYNSLTARMDIPTATDAENNLEATLSSTFLFYLENQLSFNPEVQFRWRDDGIVDAEWDWVILGGITYRLK
ncbi:MAG: hypothetical protein H6678_08005 [Candidatus Delongbacteria bacterium]|nr:hypothetical protein [Candidatus Delongbacteria bacterium]